MKFIKLFAISLLVVSGVSEAKSVQIKLLQAPDWYPDGEGVTLKTNKGKFNLYAYGLSSKISQPLSNAKKGQCLNLEVPSNFDFTNANDIKKISACKNN